MGSGLGLFHDLKNLYYDLEFAVKMKIDDIRYDDEEREKAIKVAKTVTTHVAKQIIKKKL